MKREPKIKTLGVGDTLYTQRVLDLPDGSVVLMVHSAKVVKIKGRRVWLEEYSVDVPSTLSEG